MTKSRYRLNRRAARGTALAVCALVLAGSAKADVMYTFVNAITPFDVAGVGASDTLVDPLTSISVTLTTLDVIGQDGSLASDGTNNLTNVTGSLNSLGINAEDNPGGYGNEFQDFNPGEGWVFSFNVPVELVEIDLSSQGAGARMTISSSAFADLVLDDGPANDIHSLGNTLVPAGTPITMQMSNVSALGTDTSIRITDFTVAAIPEPSVLGLLLIGAAFLARARRRRGDG